MGQSNCPPDICRIFAALFRIWSNATALKFQVMNSMMGRRPDHGRADRRCPAKPALGDGRVDDALRAELLEHPLADLVRALVVPDLFAHEEDAVVALHLLDHRFAQGLSEPERSASVPS